MVKVGRRNSERRFMQMLPFRAHYSPYFMGVAEREGQAVFVSP